MTNNLLPDDPYDFIDWFVRRTADEAIRADRCFDDFRKRLAQAESILNTRTPNKSAEVDLRAIKEEVLLHFRDQIDGDKRYKNPDKRPPTNDGVAFARTVLDTVDYLASSGYLATGKGGDAELLERKLVSMQRNLEQDCKVNGHGYFDPYVDMVKSILVTLRQSQQPAAPTQIDAGELEKVIAAHDGTSEEYDMDFFYDNLSVVVEAARAHLSKLSGGE